MKKSLLLLVACLATLGTYAQDDDIYFVPSSKNKTVQQEQQNPVNRSTYTPITEEEQFSESNWAANRGNNGWDVDEYNRRGKRYKGECSDTVKDSSCYDQGYSDGFSDGYEDASYTSRIVRFWSPRPGVYVSSPYYLDYYDLCYDPWYYGYYSPWSWGWSGWYGWGSWYGWRPYYSWGWGWGPSWAWYDPWWGPGWHHHHHYWYPSNAERGPRGGYIAYGGRRGTNGSVAYGGRGSASRPSSAWGTSGRGTTQRTTFGGTTNRPSRSFGNTRTSQPSGSVNRSTNTQRKEQSTSRPSRSFGNTDSRSSNRSSGSQRSSSSFSSPSRSSFGGGATGGGGRSFGGGGGRSGGRR